MKAITGLGIIVGVLFYFIVLFIFFSTAPPELIAGHSLSGVQINTNTTGNLTIDSAGTSSLNVFVSFAGFQIEDISPWLVLLAVYAPTILLFIGVYALIRGI